MNEIERRELKGLGGWLVLFQIQIFNTLAGALQMLVLFPIMGVLLRNGIAGLNPGFDSNTLDIYNIYFSPITYIFAAVILAFTVLCIIFFYRKRIVFRVFFIIESVIYIVGIALLYLYLIRGMANMFTGIIGGTAPFIGTYIVFMVAFGLLPMIGIMTAFIIALFKSQRVKNTFS